MKAMLGLIAIVVGCFVLASSFTPIQLLGILSLALGAAMLEAK